VGIAHYIRSIGRGRQGARSLDAAQANDLMSQLLDGRLSDLEIGAFALAMRIKGESLDELDGFLDAVQARCAKFDAPRPAVLLPSYNGARRLPNLTPLLAALLAREGVPVLVHGLSEGADARVTSAALFGELGWPIAGDAAGLERAWSRRLPAYLPLEAICPPLARLLAVRQVVGVRNSGHTLAKLIDPLAGAPAVRVVGITHAEYAELLDACVQRRGLHAMLLRGTEGEPFADPRRAARFEVFVGGMRDDSLSRRGESAIAAAPPSGPDAAATAASIRAMLEGAPPVPPALASQAEALRGALARLAPRVVASKAG
jgi:anthranilate phosphoribosyltransferase